MPQYNIRLPHTSVRDMSPMQRKFHSLSARTLWAVFVLSLLLSFAGISFGFYLYSAAINNEYQTNAWNLSKTTALVCNHLDGVRPLTEEMSETYEELTEAGIEPGTAEYEARFAKLENTEQYTSVQHALTTMQELNKASAVYIALVDLEDNGMIYLVDSDTGESHCPAGKVDFDLRPGEADIYVNGAKANRYRRRVSGETLIPAVVTNDEEYGYLCTAASPLYKVDDRYSVMAFADLDMRDVTVGSQAFLIQYLVLMFSAMLVISLLYVHQLRRGLINPLVHLAEAARTYAADKKNDSATDHFSNLNIKTGDELEELSLAMQDMEKDMVTYVADLTRATADQEHIATELELASKIQLGMLPHEFPPFPDRSEFEIYATVDPALTVGGDFYDYFLVDDDHLAMIVADVSGKGIPAALFMMGSKILLKNYATIGGYEPAEVLRRVNDALCANNSMEMFVTVWLGILEISTGKLTAANAGHEYPVFRQGDAGFELVKDKHGFILGGMEGVTYQQYEVQLAPGDMVFEYTDGVTEATAADNELFGTDRMLAALNGAVGKTADAAEDTAKAAEDVSVTDLLAAVRRAIDDFVQDAPQFDDITMLGMRYKGPPGRPGASLGGPGTESGGPDHTDDGFCGSGAASDETETPPDETSGIRQPNGTNATTETNTTAAATETNATPETADTPKDTESDDTPHKEGEIMKEVQLDLEATVENLPEVMAFVEGHLEEVGCPMKAMMQIGVAVEEIFVNIAKYAYTPDKGNATVRIEVSGEPTTVAITFIDKGVPYDPLAKEDPDITLSAEERQIGGLGIFMVKETMDDVIYEYKDGRNILTLKKEI